MRFIKITLKILVVLILVGTCSFFAFKVGVWQGKEIILKQPPLQVVNPTAPADLQASNIDFNLFWEAWRKLEQKYLKRAELDYQKMVYGAISGMVESLGDPYTVFFTPKQTDSFNEELSGQYEGVGMVVGIKDDVLKVVSPFKGTPAYLAGVESGDSIVKVGDTATQGLSVEEAVALIKGPQGTEVKLLIQRDGFKEPKEFVLKRDVITIPTLETDFREDGIAVLKLYQFNRLASSEFNKAALFILNEPRVQAIVLDLRDNPGGFLDEAVKITSWFVERGRVVTWEDSGVVGEEKPMEATGPGSLKKYPVVVLINKGSASGSEIVAGALRDLNQTKLVGEKSFGKGSVQDQIDLAKGASLKVTIAHWLTPNKTTINEQGLTPDIEVMPSEDTALDAQLDKAIEILKEIM